MGSKGPVKLDLQQMFAWSLPHRALQNAAAELMSYVNMSRFLPLLSLVACAAFADEGMWLFNQPPRDLIRQRYRFEISDAWLGHLQRSSVRFNSGGSGSFISEDGLLISNHHVAADAIQKLGTKERNYLRDGFHAGKLEEELKCHDLELNVLMSIEDVTARVNAAVQGVAAAEAAEARRKVIAQIEKESLEKTGLRSDVVALWKGGAYHLYRYKRYTDVRLVFAPEQQIAFFGGDPDNFEFPRYDLDITLMRAYENGRPVKVQNYLKFSPRGPQAEELVFVSGHPGRTSRLLTAAELASVRDNVKPLNLEFVKQFEVLLDSWSERSEENSRRARDLLFGFQNARKAYDGHMAGLLDPRLFDVKLKTEAAFKEKLEQAPDKSEALKAFDTIAVATKASDELLLRHFLLERGRGFYGETFTFARQLLRSGEERSKPDGERLPEYSDAARESFELDLLSERPVYPDMEIVTFTQSLTWLAAKLGGDDPLVKRVLDGKSPADRAAQLVLGTKVGDVQFRKRLYAGGAAACTEAKDPMIEFARLVDADARAVRKAEEQQDEKRKQAHAMLSRSRNELLGTTGNPDATGTLRLSFGTVRGWNNQGSEIPPFTSYAGLYQRAAEMKNREPYDLPELWLKRKSRLDLDTPLNFVSTCDIIGGNSGSPVVNRAGEFVGIIFDGNPASLRWDYAYDDAQGRAVAVHSSAIVHALEKVYGAKDLAREMLSGRRQ